MAIIHILLRSSFLPESPRWLVSVGKWDEANVQLQRIAKMNGKKDEVNTEELLEALQRESDIGTEEEGSSHNVTDLFKTPNLRKKTLLVTYICLFYCLATIADNRKKVDAGLDHDRVWDRMRVCDGHAVK
ncbi:hypothetical protein COOONC_24066 [Cooperia oncophora]